MWKTLANYFDQKISHTLNKINMPSTKSTLLSTNFNIQISNVDQNNSQDENENQSFEQKTCLTVKMLKENINCFDDPTLPNMYINDFWLYPSLRVRGMDFFNKIDGFCKPTKEESFLFFHTQDKRYYYSFNGFENTFEEIKEFNNTKIDSFVSNDEHYMILLDDGRLFGNLYKRDDESAHTRIALHTPLFKKDKVKKICTSTRTNYTLILCYDESIWSIHFSRIDLGFQPKRLEWFCDIKIKDITGIYDGFLALSKENDIFIWGKVNLFSGTNPILKKSLNDIKCIEGGKNSFVALTFNGCVYFSYICQKIKPIMLILEEPIQLAISSGIYENMFVLVGISGSCYVWDGCTLHRSMYRSVPDTLVLYSPNTYYSPHFWPCLPVHNNEFVLHDISFNDQKHYNHKFEILHWETTLPSKYLYFECENTIVDDIVKEKIISKKVVDNTKSYIYTFAYYDYIVYYYYFHYYFTQKTPITSQRISEVLYWMNTCRFKNDSIPLLKNNEDDNKENGVDLPLASA